MGVTDVVHVGDPHLGVVRRGSPKFGDTRTPSRGVPRGVLHFVNFGFWNLGMFFGDFLCTLVHLMFYNCVTSVLGVVLGGVLRRLFSGTVKSKVVWPVVKFKNTDEVPKQVLKSKTDALYFGRCPKQMLE